MKRTGLGRGIGALFDQNSQNTFFNNEDNKENNVKDDDIFFNSEKKNTKKEIAELKLIDVVPNDDQARKVFDEQKLNELAQSIKMFGVLQPIIVEKQGDFYKIIAGERRWRASKIAGLKTIPAIISNRSDSDNAQVSIIENLQREDLNPVEKAQGLDLLMKKYDLTGNEVSELTGINFSSIFTSLKILKLEDELLEQMISIPNLTEQACLALLETDDLNLRKEALYLITEKGLAATEALKRLKLIKNRSNKKSTPYHLMFTEFENQFSEYFGNKVRIKLNNAKKNSGKIIIDYNSKDDLERMLDLLNQ